MENHPPRILLVGAGRFGRHHLVEWQRLAVQGVADLAGAVVRSRQSQHAIADQYGIRTSTDLDPSLLDEVDGVDIVTPAETHYGLVRKCLGHTHVLVEKPLATTTREARDLEEFARTQERILMVGHVYRYHPVIRKLKELVAQLKEQPRAIDGSLINPEAEADDRFDTNLELLHLFDIIDYLFGADPEVCLGRRRMDGLNHISLRYPGPINATLKIGWAGEERIRTFNLVYSDRQINCNMVDNSIHITTLGNQVDKIFFPHEPQALAAELRTFAQSISGSASPRPDADVGSRMVDIAVRSSVRIESHDRPKVAILGGGIFGATIAIELGKFCDVTLFERHGELMTEVSYINQWRHHTGFHYPRSYDQVKEIQAARRDFEAEYEEGIIRDFPSYFCTSATGVEIPAERYLAACQGNRLDFTIQAPPAEILDLSKVSLCVRSDEAVYDFYRLRDIVQARLDANDRITVALNCEAIDGEIDTDGTKRLTVRDEQGTREQSFDYLVNATYANRNILAKWFGFPIESLRFDVYELLVLEIPIPQICVTVMDGPFTSLMGTGHEHQFMLSHIYESVLRSTIPADGLPPEWGEIHSNRLNMLRQASRYFLALKQAKVIESRFATRVVNAFAKDFDARPTVVADHGFGCWSVLGGKIITCVTNAREIAAAIVSERTAAGATNWPRSASNSDK